MNLKHTHVLAICTIALVLSACSTKKNTLSRRVYHNLTAHYNAYWNGNESLKEGVKDLTLNAKDNYAKILPVIKVGTKEEAQKINPLLDRAIEKGAKVIKMHSIFIKGKEYINWIDDAYLMIGKSNYYKQDYRGALRTFNYILSQFKNNPIKYEAMVWIAKSNIQLEEFGAAQSFLDQVRNKINEGDASKNLERELNIAYADFYVKQENYTPAIDYLLPAIKQVPKKDTKTRLRFILAQIYQNEGDLAKASELYKTIIKKNPPYEMAFNAKINLAMSYDAAMGSSKDLVKKLNKMLRDQKNKEYLDQIYFALAEVALKDKDTESAIKYLKLSVSNSTNNNYQKAVSSLKLADIYFNSSDYENAQAYYDTTIMFLPKNFPNFELIKNKTDLLSDLVSNIVVVRTQDSLQAMALMKPDARDMKINNVIAAIIKEEQKAKEEENLNRQALGVLQNTLRQSGGMNNPTNAAGEWYFYNTSTMSFGFSEFSKKWGKRKLEDLWRISNKQTFDYGDQKDKLTDEESEGGENDTIKETSNPKNKNFYLKNVPLTEEKMKKSKAQVEEALFNIGYIYYEGLKELTKAQETFDTLLMRYPKGDFTLKSYYQLYKIYGDLNNKAKSDFYKNLIINQYPESDYAKIISDPNYYKQIQAQKNEVNLLYETTYKEFLNANYYNVISNYQIAYSKFKINPIFPKFDYLKALSNGKLFGKDTLIENLNSIINKYPGNEIVPLAQMVLGFLNKGNEVSLASNTNQTKIKETKTKEKTPKKEKSKDKTEKDKVELPKEIPSDKINNTDTTSKITTNPSLLSTYQINRNSPHFFVLLVDASKININVLKIKISDFNRKYYSGSSLEITSFIYNQNVHLISVTQFTSDENAMLYYNTVKSDEYIYSSLTMASPNDFIISNENFNTFLKLKDLEGYQSFFKTIYLKDK